ncbi:hypothetical protein [Flavobacterium urocaniciphilum]|uniref:Uncharacterized protein n=1 Tax=Flavobacterium urocaniciphilum TaxID=1299341 RepID=A0A1H8Z0Y4_9FLAO|nr:hypothetical protein [Flavobacterium urocaniciphilum]SEP58179.1 hypothetical protein SAMN05444005_101422 [Flavobacterium urocaniciphilum]
MSKNKLLRRINFLEYFLIIGGLFGIVLQVANLLSMNLDKFQNLSSYVTLYSPFILFMFSIYNGLLLTYKKYELGLKLASYSFYLQLVAFTAFGFWYENYLGFGLGFSLELTNDTFFGLNFNFSQFILGLVKDSSIFEVRFNVFALFMIYYISKVSIDLKKVTIE